MSGSTALKRLAACFRFFLTTFGFLFVARAIRFCALRSRLSVFLLPCDGVTERTTSLWQFTPAMDPTGVWVQPVAGSHVSSVQALPSSQSTAGWAQPSVGSQVSSVHLLLSSQLNASSRTQLPATQVALPPLHGSPSPQADPSGRLANAQVWPPMQVSTVQSLPSAQLAFRLPGGGSAGFSPTVFEGIRSWPPSVSWSGS